MQLEFTIIAIILETVLILALFGFFFSVFMFIKSSIALVKCIKQYRKLKEVTKDENNNG